MKVRIYRHGIQYIEGPTTPALASRLIHKTTNIPGQIGRCSLEFFAALGNLSVDYNWHLAVDVGLNLAIMTTGIAGIRTAIWSQAC